ncbi:MAG: hypothetical protein QNK23_13640 [Crocinitomicaceae bacterium]|nr:hypothetical protein [Crocinitomicaceae bacterium]
MKLLSLLTTVMLLLTGWSTAQSTATTELNEIAEKLRHDNDNSFINTLKPDLEDLQEIFVSIDDVGDAWMYVEDMFSELAEGDIQPGANRTETIIIKITGAELKAGNGQELPGGYTETKDHFKDRITIYGLKFVEPGETSGYSLNAFFKVNGHWVCIPKAYRAF